MRLISSQTRRGIEARATAALYRSSCSHCLAWLAVSRHAHCYPLAVLRQKITIQELFSTPRLRQAAH